MNKDQILDIVAKAAQKPKESITGDMEFRGDLEMDSLRSLDLLVMLEEEAEIEISQAEAANIKTVNDLFNYIEKN